MSEGLLQDSTPLVDELLAGLPRPMRRDWFGSFPEPLRPSRLCLAAAGKGGRCDLHADQLYMYIYIYIYIHMYRDLCL